MHNAGSPSSPSPVANHVVGSPCRLGSPSSMWHSSVGDPRLALFRPHHLLLCGTNFFSSSVTKMLCSLRHPSTNSVPQRPAESQSTFLAPIFPLFANDVCNSPVCDVQVCSNDGGLQCQSARDSSRVLESLRNIALPLRLACCIVVSDHRACRCFGPPPSPAALGLVVGPQSLY